MYLKWKFSSYLDLHHIKIIIFLMTVQNPKLSNYNNLILAFEKLKLRNAQHFYLINDLDD